MPHRQAKRPLGHWEVSVMLGVARYLKSRHRTFEAAAKRASTFPLAQHVRIRDTRLSENPFGQARIK